MQPSHTAEQPRTVRLTVLGSGTSMGVPTVGCECAVCKSTNPRDKRTRASVLLSYNGRNVVIDTTPDFRYQALRAGLKRLDAVILTHAHADHILGLDDIRPFNLRQQAALPVYGTPQTLETLKQTFAYIFDLRPSMSTIPNITLNPLEGPVNLFGLELLPVPAEHGDLTVLGFRFGRAAYLTDFSSVPPASREMLLGLDDLILDALRHAPHPMHSSIEQSLRLLDELQPRRAWFTHMNHEVSHDEVNAELAKYAGPTQVRLAFDGMTTDVSLGPRLRVFRSPQEWAMGSRREGKQQASYVSIGNFDGLHLGHQKILQALVAKRAEAFQHGKPVLAGAVTFDPHPLKLLRPAEAPAMLATMEQRLAGFEHAGLDTVMILRFDEALSRLSAKEFVLEILVNQLCVKHVLVGANFRFGHRQAGDVQMLGGLGQQFGFAVDVVPPVELNGEIVSSTGVRKALSDGNVARATDLLGRPFSLTGKIVRGAGAGRSKLVPTLNLQPEQECLPAHGVYITEVGLDGEVCPAVTNIGVRPTVSDAPEKVTVESHLLDFRRNIEAGTLEVRFLSRLRGERKFPSLEALREQIHKDIAAARAYFPRQATVPFT